MESMNESRSIRVIIADDQELVRAGFAMVIGSQPDMEVVGQASDGAQLPRSPPRRATRPSRPNRLTTGRRA